MEIIIYETTHSENLPALLELCSQCFTKITVFLKYKAYTQILIALNKMNPPFSVHFEIQKLDESNRFFIKRFFKHLKTNNYSHLHINTLDNNMLIFTMLLLRQKFIKISMTVHSINDFKTLALNGLKNISEAIAKKKLHQIVDNYRVLAPAMKEYFQQNFSSKNVVFIPGNFFDATISRGAKKAENIFTILIPGTVEAKRRDYSLVIRFLKANLQQLTKFGSIRLVLAGNANSAFGQTIVSQIQNLQNDNFELIYFLEEMKQNDYDEAYCNANIVWNPIIIDTISIQNIAEKSSVSHSPGFITDQIHYGIPAIIPKGIQVYPVLTDCNFCYENSDDLKEIFLQILSDATILHQKRLLTFKACKFFVCDNFLSAFYSLINEIPATA